MNTTRHEGRNIKRLREIKGIKQGAMAVELKMTQQKLSDIEQEEKVNDDIMEQISRVLEIPADAIRNFDESKAINIIAQTVNNHDQSASVFYFSHINPVDKWIEALEQNKSLYERLLASEQQKVSLLEKVLNK